jgi:dipeptidyl aminopeptidase/acylaminoacyl peptidase
MAQRSWKGPLLGVAGFLFMLLGTGYFAVSGMIVTISLDPGERTIIGEPPAGYAVTDQRMITTDGTDLSIWIVTGPATTGDRAIIVVHGLGDQAWNGTNRSLAATYVDAGFTVLALDMRGHGISGGQVLGLGWYERNDIRAAVDLLLATGFAPGRIGIHGTSYGAATALLATAAIPEIGAVIADSSWSDIRAIMDVEIEDRTGMPAAVARWLRPGISLTGRIVFGLDLDEISPLLAVPLIAPRPILFIHGEADSRIPVEHSEALFDITLAGANEIWVLPGMAHTEGAWMEDRDDVPSPFQAEFLARVTDFFDRNLP